jgi:hypothetical protein
LVPNRGAKWRESASELSAVDYQRPAIDTRYLTAHGALAAPLLIAHCPLPDMHTLTLLAVFSLAGATGLAAQTAATTDSGSYLILRGSDTVAVEQYDRGPAMVEGMLTVVKGGRTWYRGTLAPDATVPLLEMNTWRPDDPADSPPRDQLRLIFKGDSVAVDHISSQGMETVILASARGAVPYLNLSFGLLGQAIRRARVEGARDAAVAFFNVTGGQTRNATVVAVGKDSAVVRIGSVEFRMAVDSAGRILGGGIPAQGLRIVRQRG